MSEMDLRIAAWLLTYALHSTVLLAAAALLTARWVRGEASRETLWKAALLAPSRLGRLLKPRKKKL